MSEKESTSTDSHPAGCESEVISPSGMHEEQNDSMVEPLSSTSDAALNLDQASHGGDDEASTTGIKLSDSDPQPSEDLDSPDVIIVPCTEPSNVIDLIDAEIISNHNVDEPIMSTHVQSVSNETPNKTSKEFNKAFVEDDSVTSVPSLKSYRNKIIEISEDSDSSDSESSSTVSEENEEDSDDTSVGDKNSSAAKKLVQSIRTRGELSIDDLPPIEDLEISVEENKCKEVGTIYCIVERQVVVQSFRNTPPLDLDTVLFLDRGQRPLGKIFDVLGNVREPLYAVRFNSADHIKEKNISKDQIVYCAPQTEYTSYVDTVELMKQKGSDASWYHNNEPPVKCVDFSDDEDEARSKRTSGPVGSKREHRTDNESFVKKMNQRNLELTAKRRKEDEAKQKRAPSSRRTISSSKNSVEMVSLNPQTFSQFTDPYKSKSRNFSTAGDQSAITRVVNFHHNTNAASHVNKYEPVSRSVNFLVGGYSSPPNFTFPPQHFLCSSPRQLPSVVPNAQNYLTMYSRPSIPSSNAMPPPPPPPPPFSSYSSASMAAMSTAYPSQPPMHTPLPPQYTSYNPMSAPPLPSALPQPNFYQCADVASVHQQTFIPMNVRPNISAASFHPQFVLPPPPPPPPPSMQHHPHQRDLSIPRPDRRNPQPPHQANASFYPHSPFSS